MALYCLLLDLALNNLILKVQLSYCMTSCRKYHGGFSFSDFRPLAIADDAFFVLQCPLHALRKLLYN